MTNSYRIISEGEAKLMLTQTKPKKISPRARYTPLVTPSYGCHDNHYRIDLPDYGDLLRVTDSRKVGGVDEDSSYGVFVSYVEIYNSYVYDLLDQQESGDKEKDR